MCLEAVRCCDALCAVCFMALDKTHMTNQHTSDRTSYRTYAQWPSVHYLHKIISSLHVHHLMIGNLHYGSAHQNHSDRVTSTQKSIRVAAPWPWPQTASGIGQESQQHTSTEPPAITQASNHKYPWTAGLLWQPLEGVELPPAAWTSPHEAHIAPQKIRITNTSNNHP